MKVQYERNERRNSELDVVFVISFMVLKCIIYSKKRQLSLNGSGNLIGVMTCRWVTGWMMVLDIWTDWVCFCSLTIFMFCRFNSFGKLSDGNIKL